MNLLYGLASKLGLGIFWVCPTVAVLLTYLISRLADPVSQLVVTPVLGYDLPYAASFLIGSREIRDAFIMVKIAKIVANFPRTDQTQHDGALVVRQFSDPVIWRSEQLTAQPAVIVALTCLKFLPEQRSHYLPPS